MTKRTNISLGDDVYARMSQYQNRINWSKVARDAIERELAYLEGQPVSIQEAEKLIEHLRAQADEAERLLIRLRLMTAEGEA